MIKLLDLCSRDLQVNIWEERTVFGSRARSLRELMLGQDAPPPLEFSKKRSRSVKNTKRDSRSIRTVGPRILFLSIFCLVLCACIVYILSPSFFLIFDLTVMPALGIRNCLLEVLLKKYYQHLI